MAVLLDGSRRLPGITQREAQRRDAVGELPIWKPPIELASAGPCPGAACCQLTELLAYKAAPLQALGAGPR